MRRIIAVCAPLVGLALGATGADAQSWWIDDRSDNVGLEVLRPMVGEGHVAIASFVVFASGRVSVRDGIEVVGELPFSRVDFDDAPDGASSAIGNPYLGVSLRAGRNGRVELGGRIPLASDGDDADLGSFYGLVASLDRYEAFFPEVATLIGVGSWACSPMRGVSVVPRLGASYVMDTSDRDQDGEAFALYALQAWAEGNFRVGIGVTGRAILTEDQLDFGERTFHQIGLTVDAPFGAFRPGLHVRFPLDDDASGMLDGVLGLHLQYAL